MSGLQKGITGIAALALILSLAACWKITRELQAERPQVRAVIKANEFLKKTLGEMTIAMTAKDKQIDRLESAGCAGQQKARPGGPARGTVSESKSETK